MAQWRIARDADRLRLEGVLALTDGVSIWRSLRDAAATPGRELAIDLAAVTAIDGAIMSLLVDVRASLAAKGVRCEITGAPDALVPIVHLYGGDRPASLATRTRGEGVIEQIGAAIEELGRRTRSLLGFAGETARAVGAIARRPRSINWRALPALIERAGTDGIPIVLLLDFLVGFVIAYQSTRQLKLYGANIYVADVVGISVTRELAPLMTAVIMSGRSAAAFAAELGTMRVSDEIDALRTMGFAPVPYLVIPRVWALALVAPVLALLGDLVAVLGGLVVSVTSLGVTSKGYFAELHAALVPSDVWTGLIKSVAFGVAIALIGCQQGLAARGAAQGVGRSTTTTVVYCLFAIVVIDTLFTMVFQGFTV